jgi:hypothetical protein
MSEGPECEGIAVEILGTMEKSQDEVSAPHISCRRGPRGADGFEIHLIRVASLSEAGVS